MSIEQVYLKMLGEAAGSRPADKSDGDSKTPEKLKDDQTAQPGEAKLGHKVAGGETSPEKLSAEGPETKETGAVASRKADVKGRKLASKDGDKISDKTLDSDGVKDSDITAGQGEYDGKPKTVVSDMTKSKLGEAEILEMYSKFITEYEAVLQENGITEYDEKEAMDFFCEQLADLTEEKEESASHEKKESAKHEKKESKKKVKMEESFQFKLGDQLGSLLESEGLTDEFKTQATTIFEAAVNEAARGHILSIQEQLEERYITKMEEYKSKLDEQVEKYLDYVVEEWVNENRLAVESATRNNIAESFMSKLKDLLEEHYVELPEEKADLYEKQVKVAEELESELNESIEANKTLSEKIKTLEKKLQVESFVANMSEIEADKIRSLAEGVDFDSGFEKKLSALKENYFPSKTKVSSVLTEDVSFVPKADSTGSSVMNEYLSVIAKMNRVSK